MQKLARAVIGTNNVDNCSRYCQTPATMGLTRTVGYGGDTGSIADIEQAGLVLIVGSNTADTHPVLPTPVKPSHKHPAQHRILADPPQPTLPYPPHPFVRPNPPPPPP